MYCCEDDALSVAVISILQFVQTNLYTQVVLSNSSRKLSVYVTRRDVVVNDIIIFLYK